MKRLLINLDDDMYDGLRRVAFDKNVPMAKLVRVAIGRAYEDEIDAALGMISFEESLRDPSSVMTLAEFMKGDAVELSSGANSKVARRSPKAAATRSRTSAKPSRSVRGGTAAKRRAQAGR